VTAVLLAAFVVTVPVTAEAERPRTLSDSDKFETVNLAAKFAVALRAVVMLTVHDAVPVHAPLQPVNVESFAAVAVSVTLVPLV